MTKVNELIMNVAFSLHSVTLQIKYRQEENQQLFSQTVASPFLLSPVRINL